METIQTQTSSKKKPKVWTIFQILLASCLSGPFAGCYLLGRNYRTFGQKKKAIKCYLIGFLSSAVFFGLLFFFLEEISDWIPPQIIPVIYSSLIASFAYYAQKQKIKDFLKFGKQRHSYFWLLFVSLVITLIQLSPMIITWGTALVLCLFC